MRRIVRSLWHLARLLVPVVAALAVCSGDTLLPTSAFLVDAGGAAPVAASAGMRPDTVFAAHTCSRGACLLHAVARWTGIPFTARIPCGAAGACRLTMDVYAPTTGGRWPVAIVLPGGPAGPTAYGYLQDLALPLAGQGAVVIVAGWRQRAQDGGGYPRSFADVACLVGVARRDAERYGGNGGRLTLMGHSLGAWPAEVVALSARPFAPAAGTCEATAGPLLPDALVAIDGAPWREFDRRVGPAYLEEMLGGTREEQPAAWEAVDPYALMSTTAGRRVPVLLVHGDADRVIAPSLSRSLQAALAGAGYDARFVPIPDAGHGDVLGHPETVEAIAAFIGASPAGLTVP